MQVTIFGKRGCARCQTTAHKVAHVVKKTQLAGRVTTSVIDMESVEGMAEAMFNEVWEIPTTIISDKGKLLARWDGRIPTSNDLGRFLMSGAGEERVTTHKGLHSAHSY